MKWQIPAKTFLVGEYAALVEGPAILLTTEPNFEFSLRKSNSLIHPNSPAGRLWEQYGRALTEISWTDPYQGLGGLGASSAQFIGSYLAARYLNEETLSLDDLLETYYKYAWSGQGVRPSGYDVLAQVHHGCVYIDKLTREVHCYDWIFQDISFILLHTGNKLATHSHLQAVALPDDLSILITIIEQAKAAFSDGNSNQLIMAIDAYQEALTHLNFVAPTTLDFIKGFKTNPDVLTIKGCGALGMDVLLLIVPHARLNAVVNLLVKEKWSVLATSENLYRGKSLLARNQLTTTATCP
ncbi:hypothetical protein ACNVED_12120 [Legionella sp. D16C41]|uniref:hypothetical protein n=1 Tax=Legionella sp. D16C41 TaxID=3402688 RepID=UPI003AF7D264